MHPHARLTICTGASALLLACSASAVCTYVSFLACFLLPASGEDFYGTYDAQDTANAHAKELGMQTVPSLDVVYTEEHGYVTADKVSMGAGWEAG